MLGNRKGEITKGKTSGFLPTGFEERCFFVLKTAYSTSFGEGTLKGSVRNADSSCAGSRSSLKITALER